MSDETKVPEEVPLDDIAQGVLARNAALREKLMPSPPRFHPVDYYPTAQQNEQPLCAFVLRCTDPARVDLFVLDEPNPGRSRPQGVLYMEHPDLMLKKNYNVAGSGAWTYVDGATPPRSHLTAHAKQLDKSDKDCIAACRKRQADEVDRKEKQLRERAAMIKAGLLPG